MYTALVAYFYKKMQRYKAIANSKILPHPCSRPLGIRLSAPTPILNPSPMKFLTTTLQLLFYSAHMRVFVGTLTLKMLDQSDEPAGPRQHLTENFETKPGLAAFQRPTSSRNHRGFGFVEFAPLTILSNPRYVREDRLLIHAVAREATLAPRA